MARWGAWTPHPDRLRGGTKSGSPPVPSCPGRRPGARLRPPATIAVHAAVYSRRRPEAAARRAGVRRRAGCGMSPSAAALPCAGCCAPTRPSPAPAAGRRIVARGAARRAARRRRPRRARAAAPPPSPRACWWSRTRSSGPRTATRPWTPSASCCTEWPRRADQPAPGWPRCLEARRPRKSIEPPPTRQEPDRRSWSVALKCLFASLVLRRPRHPARRDRGAELEAEPARRAVAAGA